MDLLYAIFFGAGVAGIAYNTLAKRVGYGNNNNVLTLVGITFVVATIVFLTILAFVL
jgi:multidrug transporter EmrE-like cation transporter